MSRTDGQTDILPTKGILVFPHKEPLIMYNYIKIEQYA
jgi:hypothetical protein